MAHEYMAPSPAGEDTVAICDSCGYKANVELARSVPPAAKCVESPLEEVETPEKRTMQEVSNFLGADASAFIKSLLVISEDHGPVLALVRGDQEIHEMKLQRACGPFRPAAKEEVKEILGVEAGFIGPVGQEIKIVADECLKEGVYICGANKAHFHIKGIRPGTDFKPEWHDLHEARQGDACASCGAPMKTEKCIEVGNIFKLGTKYSAALKAVFLDESGDEKPIIMGSYGIGPARIMAAAVEQRHDDSGMIWPRAIAPFDVHIIPLNVTDETSMEAARSIYDSLTDAGFDVLLDDRDLRAGVKFNDADLMGIPSHIIIGARGLKEGVVEFKDRGTGEVIKVKPEDVASTLSNG